MASAAESQPSSAQRPCAPWSAFADVLVELGDTSRSVPEIVKANARGSDGQVLTTLRALALVEGNDRSTVFRAYTKGRVTIVELLERRFADEVAAVRDSGTVAEITDRITALGRGNGQKTRVFIEGALQAAGEELHRTKTPRSRRTASRPAPRPQRGTDSLEAVVLGEIAVLTDRQRSGPVADVLKLSKRIEELRRQVERYRGGSDAPR